MLNFEPCLRQMRVRKKLICSLFLSLTPPHHSGTEQFGQFMTVQ